MLTETNLVEQEGAALSLHKDTRERGIDYLNSFLSLASPPRAGH